MVATEAPGVKETAQGGQPWLGTSVTRGLNTQLRLLHPPDLTAQLHVAPARARSCTEWGAVTFLWTDTTGGLTEGEARSETWGLHRRGRQTSVFLLTAEPRLGFQAPVPSPSHMSRTRTWLSRDCG